MTARRTPPLASHLLESRVTPTINVLFDFRFDDAGFFTNHTDRIATIRAAAADVGARFSDTLAAIPYPTAPGDFWKAKFDHPSRISSPEEVTNPLVPANTVVVFVGARELIGPLTLESSGREAGGSPAWYDAVFGRGQPNSYGTAATDYSPWGGSITYDLIADWHFGTDVPGNKNEFDLYTATQKALFHLLGFGMSEAWTRVGDTGRFFGPKAVAVYGDTVPLAESAGKNNYVWQDGVLSQGQWTLMDRDQPRGERITPKALDTAAMEDIGWTLQGTAPPPPPAAPPPPTVPPAPISPGTVLSVVGTGEGATARFNLNDAATFTQLATFTPYASYGGTGNDFRGGVRAVTADLNRDGVEDVVVGPGPGIPTEVRVYSGANFPVSPDTALFASGYAFETAFTGGVFLSAGDVNADGYPDVVVTPDQGGGPRVRIVSGKDRSVIADFLGIDDPNFRGGARTAVGDLNGDGNVDLVVAAGFGGGPRVAVFDGKTLRPGATPGKLVSDFFLFEQELRNGAYVAVGDVIGDGYGDLIGGGGPGGGPRVYGLSGFDLTQRGGTFTVVANYFAGDTNNRGGVPVAAKDIDGDRRADILAGAGVGAQSVVTTYLGSAVQPSGTPPAYQRYLVFESSFLGGVFVG